MEDSWVQKPNTEPQQTVRSRHFWLAHSSLDFALYFLVKRTHCNFSQRLSTEIKVKTTNHQDQRYSTVRCSKGLPHCSCTSLCFGFPKTLGGRQWPGATLSVRTGKLSEHWKRTGSEVSSPVQLLPTKWGMIRKWHKKLFSTTTT